MGKELTFKDKLLLFPLWVLTLLPLQVLFIISDFLFLILFYVIRYRKSVVLENLKNSFPDKSQNELSQIAIRFYRYLCDYFIESIYLINMNGSECNRRYHYKNKELVNHLFSQGKSIIFATSHYGNWDWAANMSINFPHKIYGMYKPLTSKVFNRLFIDLRAKFGAISTPILQTFRVVVESIKNNELFVLYLVADQRPLKKDLDYWTMFLNQETPMLTGMEKLAQRFDLAVVFFNMKRVKRGFYEIQLELITDDPKNTKPYEITEKYVRMVEQLIHYQPEYYLWSHRRWKYDPKIFNPKSAAK
ncbi:MAG: lysophospholipid acyltransferase family protein [Bacteroidales bacterium]|nr:lysophospholipid acyltransferase family protein [Bacteroidales bacterium]